MPRDSAHAIRDIRIFIAAPSDVDAERRAVERAVNEVNVSAPDGFGVRYHVLSWDHDVYPAMDHDAQSVINRQIGDRYELLIGVMWARIGAPTPRARSGTVEEYDRAVARRRATPGVPEIMFYFKRARISPDVLDPAQFQELTEFRTRVRADGALTSDFRSTGAFEGSLRIALQLFARDCAAGRSARPARQQLPYWRAPNWHSTENHPDECIVESTFSDVLVAFDAVVTQFAAPLQHAMHAFNERLDARNSEIATMQRARTPVSTRQARLLLDRLALDLYAFRAQAQPYLGRFLEIYPGALARISRLIGCLPDVPLTDDSDATVRSGLEDWAAALAALVQQLASTARLLSQLRDVITAMPTDSDKLVRAGSATSLLLDQLTWELRSGITITREAEHVVRRVLA